MRRCGDVCPYIRMSHSTEGIQAMKKFWGEMNGVAAVVVLFGIGAVGALPTVCLQELSFLRTPGAIAPTLPSLQIALAELNDEDFEKISSRPDVYSMNEIAHEYHAQTKQFHTLMTDSSRGRIACEKLAERSQRLFLLFTSMKEYNISDSDHVQVLADLAMMRSMCLCFAGVSLESRSQSTKEPPGVPDPLPDPK